MVLRIACQMFTRRNLVTVVVGPGGCKAHRDLERRARTAPSYLNPPPFANLVSMVDFVERLVLRLRQESSFSRNRHFLSLSSPEGKKALRIHRHLRSIEHDLSGGWVVGVERRLERVCLTLTSKNGRRVAYLTLGEFRLLCTSTHVRTALGEAAALG